MNDPNGLIFHEGIYHLFYQHNPKENRFGQIGWGHATSKDLLTWEHQPLALAAGEDTMIYSGCVVFDRHNLLRGPEPQLVAIYTEHRYNSEDDYHERICYATSVDGNAWDVPDDNVLIDRAEDDFRDPKVFWSEQHESWVMAVALPKQYTVLFYRSTDLRHWEETGAFTHPQARGQFWECPDLFPLTDEAGQTHWVLSLSGVNIDGESWGMFYFVGDFDGSQFESRTPPQWLDYGHDFYAGITFEGTAQDRIMMAWCGNWAYANDLDTHPWKGMMSSPRRLSLGNDLQIRQQLITAIEPQQIIPDQNAPKLKHSKARIRVDHDGVSIDRSACPLSSSLENYHSAKYEGPVDEVQIYEDHGIVEVVINQGKVVMTERL